MVKQIRVFGANIGIFHRFVDGHRVDFNPLAVFPVFAALGDFADIDFGIEVGGESFAMVAGIAVHDIQIMDFIEIMFGGVSGINTSYTGVEAATEQGHNAGFFVAVLVSPLPAIFEFGFVAGLIVGGIHVVGLGRQASVHQWKILIGQGHVDKQVGFVAVQQLNGFLHIVGINLGSLDAVATDFSGNLVAFGLGTAGQHDFGKNFRNGSTFVCHYCANTSGAND